MHKAEVVKTQDPLGKRIHHYPILILLYLEILVKTPNIITQSKLYLIFLVPSNPPSAHSLLLTLQIAPPFACLSFFLLAFSLILRINKRRIMAACGRLRSLFDNPLPENPTLIESLSSWNHHKPMKPIEPSSFAEIFGELYFQEKPESLAAISPVPTPPPLAPPPSDQGPKPDISESDSKDVQAPENLSLNSLFSLPKNRYGCDLKGNGGFSGKNSESLQLCTEGLGSESSDDVDDLLESGDDWRTCGKGRTETGRQLMYNRFNVHSGCCLDMNSLKSKKEFPPPISSIGKSGKPWVCLKSYREDGRFVLREMRIPTQELLRASREDGRLKLHFVHPDEDIAEEDEEEERIGEEDDDGGQEVGEEMKEEDEKIG